MPKPYLRPSAGAGKIIFFVQCTFKKELKGGIIACTQRADILVALPALLPERSLDTVVHAVSAAILPVWVDFTNFKGLPCAPGPATTRRGMLVTNGVHVRAVVRVVRPLDRTNYSV